MPQPERISVKPGMHEMPLVDVTGDGSTAILADRLQCKLKAHELHTNALIQGSIELAFKLHSEQTPRTYEPYINHVLRVALRLIEEFKIVDPETLAAAILHDTLEDQSGKLIEIQTPELTVPVDPVVKRAMGRSALQQFTDQFGPNDVAALVSEVSLPPTLPKQTKLAKVRAYLAYTTGLMKSGDPRARVIKHADFVDNTQARLDLENSQKRAELDQKQIGAYALHIAGLERPDSLVAGEVRVEIVQLLNRLKAETAARLESQDMPAILRSA